jgi:ABC-2 type transport system permease protein
MLNLLLHELRVRRGAIIGWGLGLIVFTLIYLPVYPSMQEQLQSFDIENIAIYQAMGIGSMNTLEGYASSTIVQFIPILLSIYALISGTATLAGEEDSGTLELMVAMPLARWQIVTIKAIAMIIATLLIALMAALGAVGVFLAIEGQIETTMTAMDLFWAVMSGWPLALALMMISFFLGAYLPSRRIASVVATLVFIVSYFGNSVANLTEQLEPLRPIFLFSYLNVSPQIFTEGVNWGDIAALLAVSVVFFVLALLSFQRRNITVGAWPWQRARVSG